MFAVDKQLLTLGGGNPEDAFKDAAGDAPFPTSPSGGSVTTEVYDQDGKYGQKFIFTGVPLTEFDDEDLKITREGDFFVVNGTLDLSDSTGADPSASSLPLPKPLTAGFEVAVSMTFPGEVVEHNRTLEGTTVTWTPKAGENLVMKAKAKATGGEAGVLGLGKPSSSSTPLLIGLVIAALLLVGGLVALLLRRGRTPAAAGAAGAAMTAAATDAGAGAVPGFAPAPATPADPTWAPPPMPVAPEAPAAPAVDSAWAPPPVLAPEAPAAPPVHDTLVVPEEAPTQVVPQDVALAPEPTPPAPGVGTTDGQTPPDQSTPA